MVDAVVVDDVTLRFIPAIPLLAALAIGLVLAVVRQPIPPRLVSAVACAAAFGSLVLAGIAFSKILFLPEGDEAAHIVLEDTLYSWVGAGVGNSAFTADLGFRFDALTAVVCLAIAFVGALVHVYSVGWLARDGREDGGVARYFCYLGLLGTSMMVLVLADNLLLLFLGWQGVAVCAYLLTSFWYSDDERARASSRLFVVNRIGDAGFVVGILLLFWALSDAGAPAVSFRGIAGAFESIAGTTAAPPAWSQLGSVGVPTLIGASFLVAVVAKTAQLPLHVSLPASAKGPVPALAAIHFAQVAASVYLVCRLAFLFEAAPGARLAMAVVGVATTVLAGSLACVERDVRKIVSLATVAQAGFLLLALSAGGYRLAIFHLTLHAFFMTLLFFAVGAIVAALRGESDIERMGGLRPRLARTWWVTAIGVVALAGVPPFAAAISTEEIHSAIFFSALPGRYTLYGAALLSGILTSFVGGRLLVRVFHGAERVRRRRAEVREAGDLMLWPMYVLAGLSVVGGLIGLPQVFGDAIGVEDSDSLGNFLARVLPRAAGEPVTGLTLASLMGATLVCNTVGFAAAHVFYVSRPGIGKVLAESWLRQLFVRGFFIPQAYDFVFGRGLRWFSARGLYRGVEVAVVERGVAEGSVSAVRGLATFGFKHLQGGIVQLYLIVAVVGAGVALLYVVGWPR